LGHRIGGGLMSGGMGGADEIRRALAAARVIADPVNVLPMPLFEHSVVVVQP